MKTLVCLVEGDAEKLLVRNLFERLVPPGMAGLTVVKFEGKQDLEKRLEAKLRGWLAPGSGFLVLRDQDSDDCRAVKARLLAKVRASGKAVTTSRVRIACHELESYYLGDLEAVEKGMGIFRLGTRQNQKRYRDPDNAVSNPKQELQRLTGNRYQEIGGTRAIAPHLLLNGANRSRSFNVLVSAIRELAGM